MARKRGPRPTQPGERRPQNQFSFTRSCSAETTAASAPRHRGVSSSEVRPCGLPLGSASGHRHGRANARLWTALGIGARGPRASSVDREGHLDIGFSLVEKNNSKCCAVDTLARELLTECLKFSCGESRARAPAEVILSLCLTGILLQHLVRVREPLTSQSRRALWRRFSNSRRLSWR